MLSPDQWDQAQTIFDRVGSLRSDALFSLTLMPDGRYEFREFEVSNIRNNDIKEDRRWVVTLPRYLSPKKPK